MIEKSISLDRIGLRWKVIFVMVTALMVIMATVGTIFYVRVSDELQASLETRGKELTRSLRSESMLDLLYEQKNEQLKRLYKKIEEHEEIEYLFILKKGQKTQEGEEGKGFLVFASHFRQEGRPMDVQSLADMHLASPERILGQKAFLGFTEEIRASGVGDGPVPAGKPTDVEEKKEEEFENEELMFGDLGDEAAAQAKAKEKQPLPPALIADKKETREGLWGYVCLGMTTSRLQRQKTDLLQTIFLVSMLGVIFFSIFIYFASNQIYRRITLMMAIARRIAEGDLSENIEETVLDEIGMLSSALNRISLSLNDMIAKIAQVTTSLSEAVEKITASTEEVVQGAEYQVAAVDETSSSISEMVVSLKGVGENVEILASSAEESSSSILEMAAANDEVADNISSLAASVEETTASIEHMTHAIKDVAKSVEDLSATAEHTSTSMREMDVSISQVETNANETASLSEEVRRDAERGAEAVKKTIQGISRIADSTRTAFTFMEALGKKVQAIGQVLNVIDDVAEQTNLLALNAAIIAAQAGEHGKGFAVVADEIKDLAERTATSTNEISDLINAVQTETKSMIESMHLGLKSVDQGVSLSVEAEQALRKIVDSATKSTAMVGEIARATVEQARGSKVVTDAIGRIAETVQQIASATAQQAKGSEQIMNSAEQMKIITQHVHSSSQEQARGSKQITQSIENISEMVHRLNRAQKEQARGSEQVMQAVERIKGVAEHHSDAMSNMKKIVDLVAQQVDTLRQEMSRFKL